MAKRFNIAKTISRTKILDKKMYITFGTGCFYVAKHVKCLTNQYHLVKHRYHMDLNLLKNLRTQVTRCSSIISRLAKVFGHSAIVQGTRSGGVLAAIVNYGWNTVDEQKYCRRIKENNIAQLLDSHSQHAEATNKSTCSCSVTTETEILAYA